jgi:hypothetical protein
MVNYTAGRLKPLGKLGAQLAWQIFGKNLRKQEEHLTILTGKYIITIT